MKISCLTRAGVVASSLALAACGGGSSPPGKDPPPASWDFIQMVNSDADATSYAYGPSIILKNGAYHVFFCSAGAYPTWDSIRYVQSTDAKNWSSPVIVLRATAANGWNLAACDPSVVLYQGFYYMYYSSAYTTAPSLFQTVIQVARSANIDGPYLTYTQRGTWEDTPTDPQMIIKPLVTRNQDPVGYGAGQQSAVVHNGEIFLWYTDDSIDLDGDSIYMLHSADPVHWTPSPNNQVRVHANSIDVKYDIAKHQYVMTSLANPHSANAYLTRSFSSNGISWSGFKTIIDVGPFPDYANNVGAAGDETGNAVPSPTLVGFGAPYDLNGFNNWGQWDLYGVLVNGP
jgi:beta-xylosidase